MSPSCFFHLSTDGHLGCSHILAIVNNSAMNIGVLMFIQSSVLDSFSFITRSEIMWYLFFIEWLLSLTITSSRSIHATAKCKFLLSYCCVVFPHVNVTQLFYPLLCWWALGQFLEMLAIVNKTAVDTGVHIFFWICVWGLFRYIPRSGITVWKGSFILIFWGISILLSTVAAPVHVHT